MRRRDLHDLGPHRGLTGRTGGDGTGVGSREGDGADGAPVGDRQGLETPELAGCLFWWFGGREEQGAAVVVDINPSGDVS
jgi:hypothetical protein